MLLGNVKVTMYRELKPDLSHAVSTQAVPRYSQSDSSPNVTEFEAHCSVAAVRASHSLKPVCKILVL